MALNHPDSPLVLVGFAQAFATVEAVWSLQAAGMRTVVLSREGVKSSAARLRGVRTVTIEAPERSASRAAAQLSSLLEKLRPDAFLPVDDAALWLSGQIETGPTVVAGPGPEGIRFALDKAAQVEAARGAGIPVLPTMVATSAGALDIDRWPAVVKPVHPVQLDGDHLIRPKGVICADPEEFRAASPALSVGALLSQPFVSGHGEGIFGYVGSDGPAELSAHRRIRMVNPHGSASSACESIPVDPDLGNQVTRMLADIRWSGLFMAEFLVDGAGTPWFMELNGRAWGSLALARRRGFEYPAWAVQHSLGMFRHPEPPAHPPDIVARHLGRELSHLLFVFRGPRSRAVSWPSRMGTVKALARIDRSHRLYNWDRQQPGVMAFDTFETLRSLVVGRSRSR